MVDEQVADLVAQVAQARRKVVEAVAGLGGDQEAFRPAEGEWSLPEIVEHLFLAEQVGVNRIWYAAQAARQGTPAWSGDTPHGGRGIDEVIEETWAISGRGPISVRTTETAPAAAVPQLRGPLGYWVACLAASQQVVQQLGAALAGLDLATVIYPHAVSGPLDARQRLEFLRWHLDHHRQQIEDLKTAPGFPGRP
jgi:hypothetical protein